MRYLILLQIGSFFHFSSESLCPYSSCTNVSLNLNELCEITCDPFDNRFHKIGNFSLNKIKFLHLKNTASIDDDTFSGLEIDELKIEAKRLGRLSANTFANITNLQELYLTNFAHLNTGHFSVLHNILQKFVIDQNKDKLLLSNNKISIVDKNVFICLTRLSQLDLSFNRMEKIDFKIPNCLVKLLLSHNRIQKLTLKNTQFFVNLTSLDLSHNAIYHVEFCQSNNLLELDLSHNRIQVVNETSFSGLVQLRNLYLINNSIYHFEVQSFGQNIFLKILNLDSNSISSIPNISLLKNLNFLSLRSQKNSGLTIQNYAFELVSQNEHLFIYLEENSKIFFDDKSFCSHYSKDKRLHFYFDNLDELNRCHFDQLKNSSFTIRTEVSCDFIFVSQTLGLELNAFNSNSCVPVDFDYVCDNERFLCEIEMKYSAWIGFDVEIFSYLKKSQICQLKKQFLCIEIFGLKINCELGDLKSENKTITVLRDIEVVINVDGAQIHIQIGHIFQNGFYKYQNLFTYLGFKVECHNEEPLFHKFTTKNFI
ncbi:Insulin-like growth factor-binding complex acid labile subunit [Brachionus plicatilis]|uniref:Insulin-like growth factor-binding complex acid labile subunit n=1 Tax=Brachionus plicatilis TaxID=10195 RepID=A0A3M7QIP9_BRAPC|nr:Insulin-like growth factor-binding complex acid labile subunit [Brachionus plicatilis]